MARRGRFARQTGGSNLSQLVYELMRAQFSRQATAIANAYYNNTDYRGGGVPTSDEVIAFLREYRNNQFITDYERDQLDIEIGKIQKEETGRQIEIMAAKIEENPADVQAVKDYISFLQNLSSQASNPFTETEAKSRIYDANIKLASALGEALKNDTITRAEFTAQASQIMSGSTGTEVQTRNIKDALFAAELSADVFKWTTKLNTAAGKGASAYVAEARRYKQWLVSARNRGKQAGLSSFKDGQLVEGTATARQIESLIGGINERINQYGKQAAGEAATNRVTELQTRFGTFLSIVNSVLGSNYQSIEQFAANKVDMGRFYDMAPGTARSSDGFLGMDQLTNMLFFGQNSLKESYKVLGYDQGFAGLTSLSKTFGDTSIVDDIGMLFGKFTNDSRSKNGYVPDTIATADALIIKIKDLIAKNSSKLDPYELAVHQRTLQDLLMARSGQMPMMNDGMSSWDLSNPSSYDYSQGSNVQQSNFDGILSDLVADSERAKKLEQGWVQTAKLNPNGQWYFGDVVDPKSGPQSGLVTMIYVNGKRVMASVAGTEITYDGDSTGAFAPVSQGYFHDLGNGQFVVVSTNGNQYKVNYDPFSGTTMTADQFRNNYVSSVNLVTVQGEEAAGPQSTFLIPNDLTPIVNANGETTDASGVANSQDALFAKLMKQIRDIELSIKNPDSANAAIQRILSEARVSISGTEYLEQFDAQFAPFFDLPVETGPSGMKPPISGGPGASAGFSQTPSFTPMPQEEFNAFRAGERENLFGTQPQTKLPELPAMEGERFLNYTFRNTPIVSTPQTSNLFRSSTTMRAL